jgi:hypothetical protein
MLEGNEFDKWLESVRKLMIKTKIAKSNVILDRTTWFVYYNDGLNPYDTMVEEFGNKFKRRFRRYSIERAKRVS